MANDNRKVQMLINEVVSDIDQYIGTNRLKPLNWFEDEDWREMEAEDRTLFNFAYFLTEVIDTRIRVFSGESQEPRSQPI